MQTDSDMLAALRSLQSRRVRGEIGQRQFDRAFQRLHHAVGVPCDRCGRPPAVIREGAHVLCGPCAQGAPRPRRSLLTWLVVGAVVLALFAIYAAQIGAL